MWQCSNLLGWDLNVTLIIINSLYKLPALGLRSYDPSGVYKTPIEP